MKIVQLLPSAAFGDAIGNNALAIQNILRDAGYETAVYARDIDKRLPPRAVLPFSRMPRLGKQDILLYHMGIGSDLNDQLPNLGGRLVIQYHNITPPKFFLPYDFNSYSSCAWGRRQLLSMARMPQRCIAVSEYNKQDLLEAGFTCPIDVCPILIPFEDYQQAPSQAVLDRYNDDWTNLIFVGRIAPHKHQEDVIRAFAWYKKLLNPKSRLFLVGSGNIDRYTKRLHDYIDLLGVKDVIFPGHIKFNEILAYYKLADVFLCMSEHEGFCVPLAEAMCFRVPHCCAGGGGRSGYAGRFRRSAAGQRPLCAPLWLLTGWYATLLCVKKFLPVRTAACKISSIPSSVTNCCRSCGTLSIQRIDLCVPTRKGEYQFMHFLLPNKKRSWEQLKSTPNLFSALFGTLAVLQLLFPALAQFDPTPLPPRVRRFL